MDIEIMTHRLWRLWRRFTGQQVINVHISEQRGTDLLAALHDQGLDAANYCAKPSRMRMVIATIHINPNVYLFTHISNSAHIIFNSSSSSHELSLYINERKQDSLMFDMLDMREVTPAWVKAHCEVHPDFLTKADMHDIIVAINDVRVYLYGP